TCRCTGWLLGLALMAAFIAAPVGTTSAQPTPTPTGACCVQAPAGLTCVVTTHDNCAAQNGVYHGDGTTCSNTTCGSISIGACCIPASAGTVGHCIITSETQCQ